ncbi:MAG: hypothetical protein WC460_00930 [Patescibacteria group bacterium]
MSLRIRRIIMFSFISAFFILGPLLIFYASGYRYDLKRNKILKTGTLMLEAKNLKKASVYLNDKLYDKPFDEKIFIYNLLPQEYAIKISKEGYYSWEKKLTVASSITTFAADIILFKKEVPLQIIEGQINDFSLSPDGQKLIYQQVNGPFLELYLYDFITREKSLIYRVSAQKKLTLTWAASSKKALIKDDNSYIVSNLQNLKDVQDISELLEFVPDNVIWDLQSDNLLYALKQNSFYEIDLLVKASQNIFKTSEKINKEFFIEGNDIFYIQQAETQNVLAKYNLNFKTAKKVLELSKSNNYHFIKSTNNYIGLIDLDQSKLKLIKKINAEAEISIMPEEPIIEFDAKAAVWDSKEKQLLVYDDFALNSYNSDSREKTFINRFGQPILKADWYTDLHHVVILFKNSLQIIDLTENNSSHNSIEIAKFDNLGNFYLDSKGENIFFNGQIGKQQGLYQLIIR